MSARGEASGGAGYEEDGYEVSGTFTRLYVTSTLSDYDSCRVRCAFKPTHSVVDDNIVSQQAHLEHEECQFNLRNIPAWKRSLVLQSLAIISRWRKYSGERFGIGMIMTNLVSNCMTPVAESGWDVGGEERMRKVSISPLMNYIMVLSSYPRPQPRFPTSLSLPHSRTAWRAVNEDYTNQLQVRLS